MQQGLSAVADGPCTLMAVPAFAEGSQVKWRPRRRDPVPRFTALGCPFRQRQVPATLRHRILTGSYRGSLVPMKAMVRPKPAHLES